MRLIDAVTAADAVSEKCGIPIADLVDVFADIQTVDAVPVRHGKWVWHESDYEYECSACRCQFEYDKTYALFDHGFEYASYCPNCGAKMDGDEA